MTKFWQNNDILWHHGLKEMHLVLKDDKNLHAHKRPDPEKFFPTKVRMTLIQVAKGSTYDPKRMPERVKSSAGRLGHPDLETHWPEGRAARVSSGERQTESSPVRMICFRLRS